MTVPAWKLGMSNGSSVTVLLSGDAYQVSDGNLTVSVQGHYGAILGQ